MRFWSEPHRPPHDHLHAANSGVGDLLEFCQRALPAVVVGTASVIRTRTVISRPPVVTVIVVIIIGAPVLGRGNPETQPNNAYGRGGRSGPAIPTIMIIPAACAEVGRVAARSRQRRALS